MKSIVQYGLSQANDQRVDYPIDSMEHPTPRGEPQYPRSPPAERRFSYLNPPLNMVLNQGFVDLQPHVPDIGVCRRHPPSPVTRHETDSNSNIHPTTAIAAMTSIPYMGDAVNR